MKKQESYERVPPLLKVLFTVLVVVALAALIDEMNVPETITGIESLKNLQKECDNGYTEYCKELERECLKAKANWFWKHEEFCEEYLKE